ncbi:hypothetical protein ABH940_003292 [Streptacidiphilus sp. BW17]
MISGSGACWWCAPASAEVLALLVSARAPERPARGVSTAGGPSADHFSAASPDHALGLVGRGDDNSAADRDPPGAGDRAAARQRLGRCGARDLGGGPEQHGVVPRLAQRGAERGNAGTASAPSGSSSVHRPRMPGRDAWWGWLSPACAYGFHQVAPETLGQPGDLRLAAPFVPLTRSSSRHSQRRRHHSARLRGRSGAAGSLTGSRRAAIVSASQRARWGARSQLVDGAAVTSTPSPMSSARVKPEF